MKDFHSPTKQWFSYSSVYWPYVVLPWLVSEASSTYSVSWSFLSSSSQPGLSLLFFFFEVDAVDLGRSSVSSCLLFFLFFEVEAVDLGLACASSSSTRFLRFASFLSCLTLHPLFLILLLERLLSIFLLFGKDWLLLLLLRILPHGSPWNRERWSESFAAQNWNKKNAKELLYVNGDGDLILKSITWNKHRGLLRRIATDSRENGRDDVARGLIISFFLSFFFFVNFHR